ncbi:MAG: acyltransferase family protein [Lachnospiraceae bacterium]|nr:acyltransferase family protein [Lachnospiraceae bacterium]
MEGKGDRAAYIDMAKGAGIILVLLSHLEGVDPALHGWISILHMPLFFILSGMTLCFSEKKREGKALIKQRAKGLLIPYLSFSVIYFLVDIGNLAIGKIDGARFVENALASLSFCGKSVMWFLSSLFLAELYFILLGLKKNRILRVMGTLLAGGLGCVLAVVWRGLFESTPLSIPGIFLMYLCKGIIRSFVVLPFVGAGYLAGLSPRAEKEDLPDGKSLKRLKAGAGVLFLVLGIIISHYYWSDTNDLIIGDPLLYYSGGLCAFAVIFLCAALPEIKLLCIVGKASLVIMAAHLDLYLLWAGMQPAKLIYRAGFPLWLSLAATVVFTLILGVLLDMLIRTFCPFILKGFSENRVCNRRGDGV